MSKEATISKSLFMGSLLSSENINRASARELILLAEFAISIRAWDALAQIAARLCAIPGSKVLYDTGLLYSALALNRAPGGRVQAEGLLQEIGEGDNESHQARAFLALGTNYLGDGDSSKAFGYYQKANSLNSSDPLKVFYTSMMIIAAQGAEGKHERALDVLNSIERIARYVSTLYQPCWFIYLNGAAVTLGKLGKKDEALKMATLAADSPFAAAYPEFEQTKAENQPSGKVLSINRLSLRQMRGYCVQKIQKGSAALVQSTYQFLLAR